MEYFKNMKLTNIEGEIWKVIKGYEDLYWISNFGRVKSRRGSVIKIKKQSLRKDGYLDVKLCKNYEARTLLVHRIVVAHFIGDYSDELNATNHINCIRSDNRVENLEICNYAYNNKYAYEYGFKKPVMMCGVKNPVSVAVVQLDLSGKFINEFDTIRQACISINFKGSLRIWKYGNKICANKGYIFIKKVNYDKIKKSDNSIDLPEFRTYTTDKRTMIATKKLRKIVQLDDNGNMIEIFDSFKLAEEKIGKKGVLDVCRKRKHIDKKGNTHFYLTCGGFNWKYYHRSYKKTALL